MTYGPDTGHQAARPPKRPTQVYPTKFCSQSTHNASLEYNGRPRQSCSLRKPKSFNEEISKHTAEHRIIKCAKLSRTTVCLLVQKVDKPQFCVEKPRKYGGPMPAKD